jgi:hypothetical protein
MSLNRFSTPRALSEERRSPTLSVKVFIGLIL